MKRQRPEYALLERDAPTNAFELLIELLERRLADEVAGLSTNLPVRENPSVVERIRSALKRMLLGRMRGVLVSEDLSIIEHDIQNHDFLCYILRHRPELPLDAFPKEDHRLIRHFVINKLLYGAVRVFPTVELYPAEFGSARERFAEAIDAGANQPVEGGYQSFGFRTALPLPPSSDYGALINHYGLNEFAEQVPEGALVDVGPYIGDSTFAFAQRFPQRPIFCFEPDAVNRARLEENVRLNGLKNVTIVPTGAGENAARLPIARPGTPGATVQDGLTSDHWIEVDALDHLLPKLCTDRIGLIKMDIEGHEQNALIGAREVIARDHPMLLIAAYHRGADLFKFPTLLRDLVPNYSFHFRHLDPCSPIGEYVIVAFDRDSKER